MSSRKLIVLTSGFPFGGHETFLETEIKYLCDGFEEVHILAVDPIEETMRQVPPNCSVSVIRTNRGIVQKLKALKGVFDLRSIEEVRIVRQVYGLSLTKGILSTLLMSLHRAKSIKQQITPHINRDDETVLYSYWCDDSALALTLLAEKRKKLKTVCRIHGWDVYFEASTLNYLPFRHFIASQLSTIYAISKRGQVYCKENWKVSDLDKVHVSRLGVTQQKNINPNPERFILVSCSNVIPLKRVDLIVKSLAKIEDKKIEWVHFGDGPQLKEVEKLANVMLPVHVSATFKGRVANQEVLNWYAENNPSVFINLSTTEGIPVSIMEAMSFGIPVIATDVGGTSEIVNNENGLLLRANPSEGEISDAITSFVDDRERMSLKSIAACQTWQKQYNADVNYSSFVDALLHHS